KIALYTSHDLVCGIFWSLPVGRGFSPSF
ncbi:hypothetical protein BMETH_33901562432425, partial [methanotrophic bacterial endosymbiont of Bathymodiolus sp.]